VHTIGCVPHGGVQDDASRCIQTAPSGSLRFEKGEELVAALRLSEGRFRFWCWVCGGSHRADGKEEWQPCAEVIAARIGVPVNDGGHAALCGTCCGFLGKVCVFDLGPVRIDGVALAALPEEEAARVVALARCDWWNQVQREANRLVEKANMADIIPWLVRGCPDAWEGNGERTAESVAGAYRAVMSLRRCGKEMVLTLDLGHRASLSLSGHEMDIPASPKSVLALFFGGRYLCRREEKGGLT